MAEELQNKVKDDAYIIIDANICHVCHDSTTNRAITPWYLCLTELESLPCGCVPPSKKVKSKSSCSSHACLFRFTYSNQLID